MKTIENRLQRLEEPNRTKTACCDDPYMKVMPDRDNSLCWNCGKTLVFPANCETKLILPKL
jgi:hypothetical protein